MLRVDVLKQLGDFSVEANFTSEGRVTGLFGASGSGTPRTMSVDVATSRAKCVCVLVASPSVFEAQCRTPRQMQLANAFARYLELATPLI